MRIICAWGNYGRFPKELFAGDIVDEARHIEEALGYLKDSSYDLHIFSRNLPYDEAGLDYGNVIEKKLDEIYLERCDIDPYDADIVKKNKALFDRRADLLYELGVQYDSESGLVLFPECDGPVFYMGDISGMHTDLMMCTSNAKYLALPMVLLSMIGLIQEFYPEWNPPDDFRHVL